jgi:hypothetical protein
MDAAPWPRFSALGDVQMSIASFTFHRLEPLISWPEALIEALPG